MPEELYLNMLNHMIINRHHSKYFKLWTQIIKIIHFQIKVQNTKQIHVKISNKTQFIFGQISPQRWPKFIFTYCCFTTSCEVSVKFKTFHMAWLLTFHNLDQYLCWFDYPDSFFINNWKYYPNSLWKVMISHLKIMIW